MKSFWRSPEWLLEGRAARNKNTAHIRRARLHQWCNNAPPLASPGGRTSSKKSWPQSLCCVVTRSFKIENWIHWSNIYWKLKAALNPLFILLSFVAVNPLFSERWCASLGFKANLAFVSLEFSANQRHADLSISLGLQSGWSFCFFLTKITFLHWASTHMTLPTHSPHEHWDWLPKKKNYILAVIFLPNIDLTNGDHKSVGHRQRLCRMVHFKPLHSQPIINFPTTDLLGSAKWTRFIIIPFEREKLRAGSFLDPRESFQGVFWVKKKPC